MFSVSYVLDLQTHVLAFAIGIITGMDPAASDVHCIAEPVAREVENVSLVVKKLIFKTKRWILGNIFIVNLHYWTR